MKISQAPKIDGKLDDIAWQSAPGATDFIQNFPNVGQPASVKTETKIVYDDDAIYVGAYLYDDPSLIRKQITARDEEDMKDVDYFSIFFDTYNDKQNGFQFLVTSTNVQTDARLGPNLGEGSYGDETWDAVWESNVSMRQDGWIVEMRIPYISLRFAKKDLQDWGLQVLRFTRRNNEISFWDPVDPQVSGFVNQFGELKGLKNIQPPLRLSFSPYVSTGVRSIPLQNRNKTEWLRNGGMDVKYGINESFTLDATLIPDFGQVVSDNVINNLSPFEVRFEEHRPFFTEGTEIFNKAGLFYSRRVGDRPHGYNAIVGLAETDPDIQIIKNPTITQLYNAIKFSGRTKKKLGIGVFNAITAPMKAIVRDNNTNERARIETEPLTNYNIIVLDQSLKDRSYLTFTNTNVMRNGGNYRDANVSAFDFNLYDNRNIFNIKGTTRYSKIFGNNPYDGFNTSLRAGKVSGNFQYFAQNIIKSDKYDPTDLGYLQKTNEISYTSQVSYHQYQPVKNLLTYTYAANLLYNRLYKPNAFSDLSVDVSGGWVFRNFWDVELKLGSFINDQHDYFVLNTPGQFVKRPAYVFGQVQGSTDSRKRLFFSYDLLAATFNQSNKDYHIAQFGLRYRFSNKLSAEVQTNHEAESNYIVLADTVINAQPTIGLVDFTDITSVLSASYHFTSRINLTMRTRYYWSKVIYNSIANVDVKGNAVSMVYGSFPSLDENINIFNVDAFFTWDFRLGSRLVVGYKNWLGDEEAVSGVTHKNYFKNFGQLFRLRHANEFTVKFIYFLDYNQMRRKK